MVGFHKKVIFLLKRFFNRDKRQRYRKRKFLGSVGLVLILVFGRSRLASDQSSNQNQNNQLAHKRVIQNNELTIYDSEKSILHHQNVINELRGGVNLTEAAWMLITIWMLQQQSAGFQPVRQPPPPPPHQQLFGGTSSLPPVQSLVLQVLLCSWIGHQQCLIKSLFP